MLCLCQLSLDYLCSWQVQVSVYCTRRIPEHLMCTQYSILLHRIDIGFLPCICLLQISQIPTCLSVVVGSGFVSTLPAFMRSSTSHPAAPPGHLAKKREIGPPFLGTGDFETICTATCQTRCDSSTTCRLCYPSLQHLKIHIFPICFPITSFTYMIRSLTLTTSTTLSIHISAINTQTVAYQLLQP